ncbi:hypothetical protein V8E53_013348 [Lactarius tabidus]
MASGLEYPPSPPVIHVFSYGPPGSFKNSVLIHVSAGLSNGMSKGFTRVRRGASQVRSHSRERVSVSTPRSAWAGWRMQGRRDLLVVVGRDLEVGERFPEVGLIDEEQAPSHRSRSAR